MFRSERDFDVACPKLGRAGRYEDGYRVSVSRLPKYSTGHVVAVAKDPLLLIGDLGRQLGRILWSEFITTPLLPEWIPHIRQELLKKCKIERALCFACVVHVAKFEPEDIDQIVSRLIRSKRIHV